MEILVRWRGGGEEGKTIPNIIHLQTPLFIMY